MPCKTSTRIKISRGAHYAIAELYRLGKLTCVVTPNVGSTPRYRQVTTLIDAKAGEGMSEVMERIRKRINQKYTTKETKG
ncbi:MAG: hypothetical protein A2Y91_00855 [Chloroflexi bacterium RBG_13_54_8]|nr:MAG: hypothetical protein A2Y91_00855 [Chloroflexi bacterium RBG_13_54_8]